MGTASYSVFSERFAMRDSQEQLFNDEDVKDDNNEEFYI